MSFDYENLGEIHSETLEHLKIIQALSNDYLNVYKVDLDHDVATVIKMLGYIFNGLNPAEQKTYSYKELCKIYVDTRVYAEDKELVIKNLSAENLLLQTEKREVYEFPYRAVVNGEVLYFQGKISKVLDSDSHEVIMGFRNIDALMQEQKVHENLLQAAREQAREEAVRNAKLAEEQADAYVLMHKALKSGMWSMNFDENGKMTEVFWSDEFRKMLGYKNEEDFPNVLSSWSDLLHAEDKEQVLENYFGTINDYSGVMTYDVQYRLKKKNGKWNWYHAAGKLSRRADGTPVRFIGLFIDVNEEHLKNDMLKNALYQAEQANRAKTIFLNNMSHDIRTPMNAIVGFTSLASAHLDNIEQVKEYLGKISVSSNHLLSLINDVLDMSRIESGKVQINERETPLADIMHDVKTIIQSQTRAKQLDLFIDTIDVVDEVVYCDKMRLNQVFLNLLSNAVKFTMPGGMVSVKVIQTAKALNGVASYEFRVKDTGIGMSKEFVEHVFEPFERERTSTVSGIQGTGLGMAISKNIIEMMGGTITVESEKGKGSEFIVSLRLKIGSKENVTLLVPQLQGLKVLVADDHFETCASVTKMLHQIGMRSEWTTSGKEAILRTKLAKEQNDEFAAYIIDWFMLDMNGIETVRQIRRLVGNDKPIILLTSYDWHEVEEEAREAGVTAFVSKPLFISELKRVLTEPFMYPKNVQTVEEDTDAFAGNSVLLVEDNDLNREIAVEILQERGLLVATAENGKEAVELMSKAAPGQYQLILMDIQMPIMNGYEATKEIRCLPDQTVANIPIIAMTADAFEEDRQHAFDVGMNGHITKPIDVTTLLKTISEFLKNNS
ncbi:MAG: response regulator [Phascolarctobacterium sp.]|nr:response regulator [Phascolarctobacterium sp.]